MISTQECVQTHGNANACSSATIDPGRHRVAAAAAAASAAAAAASAAAAAAAPPSVPPQVTALPFLGLGLGLGPIQRSATHTRHDAPDSPFARSLALSAPSRFPIPNFGAKGVMGAAPSNAAQVTHAHKLAGGVGRRRGYSWRGKSSTKVPPPPRDEDAEAISAVGSSLFVDVGETKRRKK